MYDFYLTDDDEETRKMRERFMMAAPQQAPYGAAVGGVENYGAPAPELDPRAVASFLNQRPADEPRGMYPIPQRDEGSWLENNGFAAAAGIADLIANKGRGLGQIVQGAAQGEQYRRKRSDEAFENDRAAYLKQGEAAARDKQLGIAGRNADMRQLELDASLAKERAIQARFLSGLPDPELEKRAKEAEINLRESQAYKNWSEDPNALDADRVADREMRKQLHDQDLADRQAGRAASAEATAAQREATAALRAQEATRQAEKDRQGRLNKFRDETEKTRPALGNLQRLEAIVDKPEYAKDLPGVGMLDSRVPRWAMSDDAIAVQSLRGDIGDLLGRQRSGAAIPPAEYARLSRFSSGGEAATEKEFKAVKDLYKKHLFAEIQQQSNGREDDAREVLGSLSDYALGPRKVAPPPTAAVEPPMRPLEIEPNKVNQRGFTRPTPSTVPITSPYANPAEDPLADVNPDGIGLGVSGAPKVNDYLRRLADEDDDLGVVYR